MTNMNRHLITRRAFARKCIGAALPILTLPASSVLAQATQVPQSGRFYCHSEDPDFKISVSYSFHHAKGRLLIVHTYGTEKMIDVQYGSAVLNGNVVTLSKAIVDPENLCPDSTADTVPDFAKTIRIVLGPPVKLILADDRSFAMQDTSNEPVPECFLSTACMISRGLPDDCVELQTLRHFRDGYLCGEVSDGPALIRGYYAIAPGVVRGINALDDSTRIWDHVYHTLVSPTVAHIRAGRPSRAVDHYTTCCLDLADSMVGIDPKITMPCSPAQA